jgi:hypothetical protein
MLSARQVPKQFWPEAVKWATYVLNRSPTLSVKDMTPEEAWCGVKPSVHHFRTFGCIGHVHIHDSQRRKLDDKSKKCVLLGVSEESKAYKLYDPINKKIIISRDVVFEESKSWNWNSKGNTKSSVNINPVDENEDQEIDLQHEETIEELEHDELGATKVRWCVESCKIQILTAWPL